MAKSKTIKKHVRGGKTYTCCLRKDLGIYPITIREVEVQGFLAKVPSNGPGRVKLNSKNPRVENDLDGKKSQQAISTQLNNVNSDVLRAALERNGGQIEHLVMGGQGHINTIVEGNRRQNQFSTLIDEILVVILPDDTPEELVLAYETTIHISGKEEWESSVKSKLAYDLYIKNQDWKLVAAELQFKNVSLAKKYVNAHIWHREAAKLVLTKGNPKIDVSDADHWSKFHHAVNPTLAKFFGYDMDAETFSEPKNFKWFCQLIKNGKLTDCRQSDGIVRPVVALANTDEDDDTYARFKKIIEKDGCELAWSKWRQMKKKNQVPTNLTDLTAIVEHINKAKARWGAFKGNKLVQGKVLEAIAVLEEFSHKISDDAEAA
jgi:hypothetical protein